jgi:hypothetical protein
MWTLNLRSKHQLVADAYDQMLQSGDIPCTESMQAAVFANGEMYRSFKAKEIFDSMPIEEVDEAAAMFLMHAYALGDRLGSAERLMFALLSCYMDKHPDDTVSRTMLERLGASDSVRNNTQGAALVEELRQSKLGSGAVPFGAWVSLLHIYGQRLAWQQCWGVLTYLEGVRNTQDAYVCDLSQSKRYITDCADDLVRPVYAVTTPFQAPRSVDAGLGMQWSAAYHVTLRALTGAEQWQLALHLIQRMQHATGVRDTSSDSSSAFATPQIPAVISLLKALTSSVPQTATTRMTASGSDRASEPKAQLTGAMHSLPTAQPGSAEGTPSPQGHDAYRDSVHLRRQLVVALTPAVTSWLKKHAVPVQPGLVSHRRHIGNMVTQLAADFTTTLCTLNLPTQARHFVAEIMQHVRDTKFPKTGGSSDPAGVVQVVGFRDFNWLAPYLRLLSMGGDWESSAALHRQMEELERTERRALRKAVRSLSAEGTAVQGNEEATAGDAVKEGSWVAESLKKRLRRMRGQSLQREDMYHDTATAMRRSGRLTQLAKFLEKHKVEA